MDFFLPPVVWGKKPRRDRAGNFLRKGFSWQPEQLLSQPSRFYVTQQSQQINIWGFAFLSLAQAPCLWPLIKPLAKHSPMTQLQAPR